MSTSDWTKDVKFVAKVPPYINPFTSIWKRLWFWLGLFVLREKVVIGKGLIAPRLLQKADRPSELLATLPSDGELLIYINKRQKCYGRFTNDTFNNKKSNPYDYDLLCRRNILDEFKVEEKDSPALKQFKSIKIYE